MKKKLFLLPPKSNIGREETAGALINEISRLFKYGVRYTNENNSEVYIPDFNHTQRFIIGYLYERGAASQLDLAKALRIKPPTVSVALKKLEQTGYVTREASSLDKRYIDVRLTEKGKRHHSYIIGRIRHFEDVLILKFSDDEIIQIKKLLSRMRDNIVEELPIEK